MYKPNKQGAVRHNVYFFLDGDIIIKVEETVFRIHKYFLTRESNHFRSMFIPTIPCRDPPGSSETNPVVLDDADSESFADLLWIFYNPKYSIYNADVDKWRRILFLAQQWRFVEVQQLCIRELEKLPIPPVKKIQIYQEFNLDHNLLHGSYLELTTQDDLLDMAEAEQVGLSTFLKISQAREFARRGSDGRATSLQESHVESVVKNVFRLGLASASTTTPPQPTTETRQASTSASDDYVDKQTAKSRKNNKT